MEILTTSTSQGRVLTLINSIMKIVGFKLNIRASIIILEAHKVITKINSLGPTNSNKRSNTEIRANM